MIDTSKRIGEIRLSSAHTLIAGHKPVEVQLEDFKNRLKGDQQDVMSFGLFEVASPNYSTYYPEVSAKDLDPQEDEFIYPVFRMLSETIVSKGAPIDFGKAGVLKKSMSMLLGQTINIDHETAVGNAIGALSDVFWQESYKDKSGVVVPAGINAVMKIDGKSNPRIARGIMMSPPSIHSNSVTVRFGWEPSHKFDEDHEFFEKVGTYDKNGELIRLVVNEVRAYNETSLVSHGADPYAQIVNKDGKINNPKYASRVYNFSAGAPVTGCFELDYKTQEFSLNAENAIPNKSNNNSNTNKEDMNKFFEQLASEFGFKQEDLTEDNLVGLLKAKFDEVETEKTDALTALTSEKDGIAAELATEKEKSEGLQSQLDAMEVDATLIETMTQSTREEAIKFYKLCKGEEVEENIINLIAEAKFDTAKSFLNQYSKEADEKFAATCNDCNSTNVSRASAKTSTSGLIGEDEDNQTPKTVSELRSSLKEKNRKKSLLFKQKGN